MDSQLELKLLTLNCWGIACVSKNRRARFEAIAEVLAAGQYDVICLQEVWTNKDYNLLKDKSERVLPFTHYFHSGVTGSGVCIFSKHEIQEAFFHQWSVNGYIHKLHHADWFGGKGVGLCRLKINNFNVNIYTAHLHAEYDREWDEYLAHRTLQAYDTAQFILLTSGGADLVVLAGDLNTEPGDLAYRIILSIPGLLDAFDEAKGVPEEIVATNESSRNSYTPCHLVKGNIGGKRIDYVLYQGGSKAQVDLKKYNLPLPDRVPNCSFSYSDHEGIEVILVLNKKNVPDRVIDWEQKKLVLEESLQVLEEALGTLKIHQTVYLLFFFILVAVLAITLIFETPSAYAILFYILRAIITGLLLFTFIMATLWNRIERHAILAGKLEVQVNLKRS